MRTWRKKVGNIMLALTLFASLFAAAAPVSAEALPESKTKFDLNGGFKYKSMYSMSELMATISATTTHARVRQFTVFYNIYQIDANGKRVNLGPAYSGVAAECFGCTSLSWSSDKVTGIKLNNNTTYELDISAYVSQDNTTYYTTFFSVANILRYPTNRAPDGMTSYLKDPNAVGAINFQYFNHDNVYMEAYDNAWWDPEIYKFAKFSMEIRLYEGTDPTNLTPLRDPIYLSTTVPNQVIGYKKAYDSSKFYTMWVQTKFEYTVGTTKYIDYKTYRTTWTPLRTLSLPSFG